MNCTIIYLHDFFEDDQSPLLKSLRSLAGELSIPFMRPFLYENIGNQKIEGFTLKHLLARILPLFEIIEPSHSVIIFTHNASAPLFSLLKEFSKSNRKFIHITFNPLWDFPMMRRELFKKGRYKISYRGNLEQELSKTILKEWSSILHLPKDESSIIITDLEYDELHNTKHESQNRISYSHELESLYYKDIEIKLTEIIKNLST